MPDATVNPIKRARRKRGETRPAILQAAIKLMMEEGPESLTTTRLAKEVGIVQSGFYAHFKTIEECLHAVVDEIDHNVRAPLAEQMAQLRLTDAGDPKLLEEFYQVLFDRVEENWQLMEVFLYFRGDRSTVGKMLIDFEMSLVEDLKLHLYEMRDVTSLARVFVDTPEPMLTALSQMLLSQSLVGIMHWKTGNIARDVLARLLAQQTSKIGDSVRAAL